MRNLILVFWLLSVVAVFGLIPEPVAVWLKIVAAFLVLAHLIEFFLFQKAIKIKGDSGVKSFAMTMLYGVFYFKF